MIDFLNSYIFGPGLCITVFGAGVFFLIYLKGFFIIKPKHIISMLKKGNTADTMSPMKAMIMALAGTLGVGNIVGVASAIAVGGAGSVFWMLVSALAALPIKYAETVLSVRHRRTDSNGTPHGGAWFYLSDIGSPIAKVSATIFAVICLCTSLSMGCMVQANAISTSLYDTFSIPPLACGLILTVLLLFIASGGVNRISFVTYKMIPLMSIIYVVMSLFIILTNIGMLDEITKEILSEAFNGAAICGGVGGFITSRAIRIGVTRGIVSNEAGCGTAPIAHAGAPETSPAAQGVWGMAEVFIDTVVICTLTALSVLIAMHHGVSVSTDGMVFANKVFGRFIPLAAPILSASIFIFAFCTMICWFHYGAESLLYLTKKHPARTVFLFVYSICASVGAISTSDAVWSLSDLLISLMTAINTTALLLYVKEIKTITHEAFFSVSHTKKRKRQNKDNTKF